MIKQYLQRGASLLELLVAIGVFAVGVVTILFLTVDAGTSTRGGVLRTQAILFAQEGLEATRSIRDNDFDALVNGTYGLVLSGGNWVLSGSSDAPQTGFTRTVVIEDGSESNSKKITSTVAWPVTPLRSQQIQFSEYLTNWDHPPLTEIQCFHVDLSGASIEQGSVHKIVRYIWISNPSCGYTINLDKIILTWDIPDNDLFKVRIDSYFLWQGTAASGEMEDLEPNEALASGAPAKEIDQLRWRSSILGTPIGVTFIMSDGSSESFTIPAFTE